MRNTRKLLLLPVVAVASAAVVLFANISLSVASVPTANEPDAAAVGNESGAGLTVKDWNETAGSNNKKGGAGGANGGNGCPI
jgi:hypothetical protein